MSENRHGEPWEVDKGIKNPMIFDRDGTVVAHGGHSDRISTEDFKRAVLCVNACEGMSDEEVKQLVDISANLPILNGILEERNADNATLKFDLAEAVRLLERLEKSFGYSWPLHEVGLVKTLLTKHKKGV